MNRLEHPLLGYDPLLTAGALAFLVTVLVGTIAQYVLGAFVFVEDRLLSLVWLFDGFVGVLILAVGVSWLVAILYGWMNGGPLLVALIALLPTMVSGFIRLEPILSVDLLLAGAAGTLAVWLAAWTTYPPGDTGRFRPLTIAIGGFVSTFALVILWRSMSLTGPYADRAVLVAWILLAIGLLSGVIWTAAQLVAAGSEDTVDVTR